MSLLILNLYQVFNILKKLTFTVLAMSLCLNSVFAKNRFFEERYRGWLWFDEVGVREDVKGVKKRQFHQLTKKEIICNI